MIVIMVAQLINGCLLPFIAALLYLIVNLAMAPTVALAIFLAAVVLSNQLCGRIVALEWWTTAHAMRVAAPVAAAGVVGLSVAVHCLRRRPTQTEPTPPGVQITGSLQTPSSCTADPLARPAAAPPTEVVPELLAALLEPGSVSCVLTAKTHISPPLRFCTARAPPLMSMLWPRCRCQATMSMLWSPETRLARSDCHDACGPQALPFACHGRLKSVCRSGARLDLVLLRICSDLVSPS